VPTVLRAARAFLGGRLEADAWLVVDGERVVEVGTGRAPAPADVTLAHGTLAPGLVDLQVNGALGHEFATADDAAWAAVLTALPRHGVTTVLPTLISAPVEDLAGALERLGSRPRPADGAGWPGVHVEGPFLAPTRRGAHPAEHLVVPEPARLARLVVAGDGLLRVVTLAPELDGGLDAVATLVDAGVVASIGHSDADEATVRAAVDRGARLVTHLHNAQRPLGPRDAGVVGAALDDERLTLGLIADLHHVGATTLRLTFALAGDRVALVSDASPALGLAAGRSRFAGEELVVTDPELPPTRPDGTLAGSSLRLDAAVDNAIACGVAPEVALAAATRVPAGAIGLDDVGRIAAGARADLVWLDERWRTAATWIGGRLVHVTADGGLPGGAGR
jgi:N-acetylglucosamine-6-phosphate deacetylase